MANMNMWDGLPEDVQRAVKHLAVDLGPVLQKYTKGLFDKAPEADAEPRVTHPGASGPAKDSDVVVVIRGRLSATPVGATGTTIITEDGAEYWIDSADIVMEERTHAWKIQ